MDLVLFANEAVLHASTFCTSIDANLQKLLYNSKQPQLVLQAELRWLDLSQCKLTGVQEELTRFVQLQMLYLHANQITKLSELKKLGKLQHLQKLTLHGNPVAELPHYK